MRTEMCKKNRGSGQEKKRVQHSTRKRGTVHVNYSKGDEEQDEREMLVETKPVRAGVEHISQL